MAFYSPLPGRRVEWATLPGYTGAGTSNTFFFKGLAVTTGWAVTGYKKKPPKTQTQLRLFELEQEWPKVHAPV